MSEQDFLAGFKAAVEACSVAVIDSAFDHSSRSGSADNVKLILDASTKIVEDLGRLAPVGGLVTNAFRAYEFQEAEKWLQWAGHRDLLTSGWDIVALANALSRQK